MRYVALETDNSANSAAQVAEPKIDWGITSFIVLAHLMAIAAIPYMILVKFSWATLGLALLWGQLGMMSISGGYHRLLSHKAYDCAWPLKFFYLFFGASAFQHTAINWCADHRRHHASTDQEGDPYNIQRGFWWAHFGWLLYKDLERHHGNVADLRRDKWVVFQHENYALLAVFAGLILPTAIAALWGDALGGLMVAGFLRLGVLYQSTFAVNSVAHCIGTQPYTKANSARDSVLVAFLTWGEGYHNFHHRFPTDYRNGIKAHHFDPTKWLVWACSKVGITWNLRRVPSEVIESARQQMRSGEASGA